MKQCISSWECGRSEHRMTVALPIAVDMYVVRRILAARYQPKPDSARPSWLTVLGHAKDRLWRERKSVVEGKSVDPGGRRIIRKKKDRPAVAPAWGCRHVPWPPALAGLWPD